MRLPRRPFSGRKTHVHSASFAPRISFLVALVVPYLVRPSFPIVAYSVLLTILALRVSYPILQYYAIVVESGDHNLNTLSSFQVPPSRSSVKHRQLVVVHDREFGQFLLPVSYCMDRILLPNCHKIFAIGVTKQDIRVYHQQVVYKSPTQDK